MRFLIPALAALGLSLPLSSQADNGGDVVVGTVLGGGVGAVIGHQLGGRDGAIVGGVIGAAAGAAIAQDDHRYGDDRYDRRYQSNRYDRGYDDGYAYNDRYQTGYRVYETPRYRERIVVESPRHYYRGNEFVYGYPDRDGHRGRGWNDNRWDDNGRHRGYGHDRYERYDGGRVVIIEPAPRRDWRYGR